MAEAGNGLDCLPDDLDIHFTVTGGDSINHEARNHCIDQTENNASTQSSEVPNFFFPRLDQLTDTCTQMTDLTNSLPRGIGDSCIPSQTILAKLDCSDLGNNIHGNAGQMDSIQQKSLETDILASTSYDNTEQYCSNNISNNNGKPMEPTDVYGRVTNCDGKIVLQLRLINLNTNFPINVSECWLCRNKVNGSSPLYVHKHTFSGMFQVNDESVNLIIPETNPELPLFSNKSCEGVADMTTSHSMNLGENLYEFSSNDLSSINENILSTNINSSSSCLLPYMAQAFSAGDKTCDIDTNIGNSSSGWFQNKTYHNNNCSQSSSGYNIHCAVDNIYNKTNSAIQNKITSNVSALCDKKSNEVQKTKEDSVLHSLETLKTSTHKETEELKVQTTKKTETGARKRKSKAQKKLSVIRMRLFESAVLDVPFNIEEVNNSSTDISSNSAPKLSTASSSKENPSTGTVPYLSPNCADSTLIKKSQKQFDSNYNLVKHIIEKTENLKCKFCNETFNRNFSDYKKHLIEEHDQSSKHIFECPVCLCKFGMNKHLVQHVKTHIGHKSFKCDQCGTTYGREESLKRHLMNHTGRRPYSCSICPKTFVRSEYLAAHMQAHNRSKHVCEKCGEVCSSKFNLGVHLKIHSKVKPFMCELCSKSFVRSDFLDNHMEVVHKKNKPKCNICNKVFSRRDVLKRHEKMHKNITYDCKFCMKTFSRKDRLLAHKRTHGINNELKCSKCPAAFRRRDVLQKHEKLHDHKEQCHICFKFTTKEKLVIHLNWHKKEMNNKDSSKNTHICETCGKVLTRKDLLAKHIKRVHGRTAATTSNENTIPLVQREKSFICDICSKGFTRSCNLRTHVLKVHTMSAARKQMSTEGIGKYNEEYDEDDPDGIDHLNSALNKSRHNQSSNLVDLSSWTSNRQSSIESVIRHHNMTGSSHSSSLLAVSNTNIGENREAWYPRPHSVSPSHTLPGSLSLPQLTTQHPHSPINLSAEAITAAAYLLAYPSYLGPYQ